MSAAAWILAALAVTAGMVCAGEMFRRQPQSSFVCALLAGATVFISLVIGSYLATGWLELLTGARVVSTNGAALVAALGCLAAVLSLPEARRNLVRFCRERWVDAYKETLSAVRAVRTAEPPLLAMSVVALPLVLALSSFVMAFPRGTEGMAYHLPNGIMAMQNGSLRIATPIYYSALPANSGLWYAFVFEMLSERFVALGQLPFLPLLAVSIYGIARRAGADRRAAVFAAAGLLSIPVVTLQATLAESDVAGLTFLAIALYFLISSEAGTARYVFAGLAIGLAFGFKSLNLQAALLLIAVAVTERAWRPKNPEAMSRLAHWPIAAGIVITAAFVTGGFWPARNMADTGNPLYPVYFKQMFDVLGWPPAWDVDYSIFSKSQFFWVRSPGEWLVYPWIEWHYADAGTHYKSNAGLGAFFAAVVPISWLHVALSSLGRPRQGHEDDALRVRSMLLVVGTLLVSAWFILDNREPRYVSPAWIFLCPLVGWTISATAGSARRVLEGLLWIAIGWMFFSFVAQELVTFGDRIIYSRHFARDQFYEYPRAVDRLPEGAVIVNLGDRAANYALVGSSHRNRVIDYFWSLRTFGIDVDRGSAFLLSLEANAKGVRLETGSLRKMGATHLYVRFNGEIEHDSCLHLLLLDELERNPLSGARLDPPKRLYAIQYCTDQSR